MATEKINLQPLKDEGLNDWEEKVVAAFEKAFESLSEPGLDDAAKLTATQLQELIPFDAQPNNIEFLFERLWAVVANIAKYVPYRHQGQAFLVQVLVALNSSGDPWKGLPYLVICLRDNWIDPTFEVVEGEEETYSLEEWLNFNSFTARLFGANVSPAGNFAVWQLRHGLEEDLSDDAAAFANSRIAVASEWLIQAGARILPICLVQEQEDLDEHDKRSLSGGELYTGLPGFDLERWGFWKRRLLTLREETAQGSINGIEEAIDSMHAAAVALVS
ncbi:hypothetical protein ACO1O0_003074 [Amphichorda felina]